MVGLKVAPDVEGTKGVMLEIYIFPRGKGSVIVGTVIVGLKAIGVLLDGTKGFEFYGTKAGALTFVGLNSGTDAVI